MRDKVLVLIEGHDAAGKDGVINRIVRHLSVRGRRVLSPWSCGKERRRAAFNTSWAPRQRAAVVNANRTKARDQTGVDERCGVFGTVVLVAYPRSSGHGIMIAADCIAGQFLGGRPEKEILQR
ncbi:hypothetical protein DLJ53_08525 [Acuticoccus sediminis]|uniref:Polyphosphate kinase-2-related domain-containing protein n=1 Tax=Acuticoccus sediminis TaxID=2184697 RepID=A0A8B2NVR2_9HYPH|nr:hypothetical protein [Acuticoccus sediminis]RAI01472.1 hypothetical protein DLJ53_08525 [Acuticoccus sediminis]